MPSDGNDTPRSAFTEGQRAELADIVAAVMRQQQQQGGYTPNPPPHNGTPTSNVTKEWNAEEIGFFDPDYEGTGPVVNAGKHVFYKDIYVFIDRCKDMTPIRGDEKLRTVLPQCFRGAASIWHSTELSEMEKILLRGTNLSGWYEAMIHRFKERTPVALASLHRARYTMSDARDRKDPRTFVQDIIRHSKAANFTSVQNQLTLAWNGLDLKFRLHVAEPTPTTTVRKFLEDLDGQADMWYQMAHQESQSSRSGSGPASKKPNKYDKRDLSSPGFSDGLGTAEVITNFMNMFMQNQSKGRAYSNYQNRNQSSTTIEGKKPLQITSGSNTSDSKKKERSDRPDRDRPDRSKGYNKGRKAYVVDEEDEEEEPRGYYQQDEDEDIDYYDPEAEDDDEGSDVAPTANLALPIPPSFRCRSCGVSFESNNRLHRHIRNGCHSHAYKLSEAVSRDSAASSGDSLRVNPAKSTMSVLESSSPRASIPIIKSSVDPNMTLGTGYGFRGFQYATASYALTEDGPSESGCLDTGCGISMHDVEAFTRLTQGKVPIRKMATPITVRGIGTNKHSTVEYAIMDIYLKGIQDGKPAIAVLRREVHLVKDLKANFLIGNDILGPEKVSINLSKGEAHIGSCDVTIALSIKGRATPIHKPIHLKKSTIVPAHTVIPVPIHHLSIPSDRDFMFEPGEVNFSLYAHMMNSATEAVLVRNDEDRPIRIPRNLRLGYITEVDYPNAFYAGSAFPESSSSSNQYDEDATSDDIADLARRRPKEEHKKSWFKKVLAACATVAIAVGGTASPSTIHGDALVATAAPEVDLSSECVLPNGVTIHNSGAKAVQAFTQIVEEYSTIWTDQGFAKLPEEHWMRIPLKADWEDNIPGKIKVYPLGTRDREFIDQTFDELHRLGRMDWTNISTSFSYPCFVVWRTLSDGTKKGRVVVDVRGLNAISLPDVYALPLQSEVIMDVRDCRYITVVDCSSFFYQWRVHRSDRHKLTVVTHRGQESFNVAVMGYKNSPAYVQRQIDRVLRAYRKFARAYIDDIVIFSRTLEEHCQHLRAVFGVLKENNISIKPSKAFVGYPSVKLLGQKVDSLGLATAEEKLAAISKLKFPTTLRQLETYLGLTGWLREYVEHYAKKAEPLQLRKTALLKGAPVAGTPRRAYAGKTKLLDPTEAELNSYKLLQEALGSQRYLVHYNPVRQLYADIDSSKETGMGAMIYHVKDKDSSVKAGDYPARSNVEPIIFLSRLLTSAETRYWPTELELAGLVWVIRKIRHLIETSQAATIFYTDHGAALGIARQTTLSTSSTDKLNLRLMRASDYIQRFNIILKHKPGKQHIVPDALSRLPTDNAEYRLGAEGELDVLFTTSLVEMDQSFKQQLSNNYEKDPLYVKIAKILDRRLRGRRQTSFFEGKRSHFSI